MVNLIDSEKDKYFPSWAVAMWEQYKVNSLSISGKLNNDRFQQHFQTLSFA